MYLNKFHPNYKFKKLTISLTLLLVTIASTQFAYSFQDLPAWLRRMECYELLALHLEEQVQVGTTREKEVAAKSLADLYASMLSNANDEKREQLLAKAKQLLTRLPALATTDLRLQLMRGSYLAAELILEQYRFRIVDSKTHAEAITQLRDVNKELAEIRPKLMNVLRSSGHSLSDLKSRNAGLSTTLLAWSTYYLARHDKDSAAAQVAAKLFAEILQAQNASLQEVSTDLRIYDYGARALLGIALCKEISNDPAGPEPWLEQLEVDGVWPDVKRQIPLWRLHIMIDANRWHSVITLLNDEYSETPIPDYWLLLIASRSLEVPLKENAPLAAAIAIEQLVKLGRLSMVSGLVNTHGKKVLENTNFVAKYILADLKFQKLKEKWIEVNPSENGEKKDDFAKVAQALREAIEAEDAKKFNHALSTCRFLLAHALFQAGQFAEAAIVFSEISGGNQIEEAMWMTIVSLDQLKSRNFEQEEHRDLSIERYITLFPNASRTNTLKLHRSFDEITGEQSIDELLSIARHDPIYNEARMRVEDLLYSQWRVAEKLELSEAGTKYLEIAVPALEVELEIIPNNDAAILSRSRRILEVALHHAMVRTSAAENIFDIVDEISITSPSIVEELIYRKIQYQLIQGNITQGVSLALSLLDNSPFSSWNKHAAILLLNSIRSSPSHIKNTLRSEYFRIGSTYIGSLQEEALKQTGQFSVATDIVNIGHEIWKTDADEQTGSIALLLARRLNLVHKQNRVLLRLCALLEEGKGDREVAISHWRTLSSGISKGTPDWFEARYKLVSLLHDLDPIAAQNLFAQHHALYPTYGPPPFDKLFQELEHTIQNSPLALDASP